ncbi:MAG: rod shape-determining protein [Bryobacteraceae bacterium]
MTYRSLFRAFSSDLAIDLGTANTLVYVAGKGIVVNEPSMVAINRSTGEIVGCGAEAKEMLGRTPTNIVAIRPLRDGVIADFKMAERMLNYFIQKAHKRKSLVHPRIVVGVPSETTEVEKRAVLDSAYRAKASEVYLVEQAMVAALGAGLPVTEPCGNMVVDIGGGTTDIAVISLSGIVYSRSIRVAGNQFDDAIMEYVKKKYNLLIGERTAEKIKMEIGSAYPLETRLTLDVKGRDLIQGLPKTVTLNDEEIREAVSDCVGSIVGAVRAALERTPPELSGDIAERGIILTGGGSLLKRLDEKIRVETGLPVLTADEPLASVVLGTGKMLADFKLLRKMAVN